MALRLDPKSAAAKAVLAAAKGNEHLIARPSIIDWRGAPRQRRHEKYRNVRCEHEGQRFDSRAELRRWLALLLLQRAGEISELRRQVPFVLIPKQRRPSGGHERECSYVADFVYVDRRGQRVVEDVKGAVTPEYRLKRKLLLHVHGIEIREVAA